jgi:hypothetical protein
MDPFVRQSSALTHNDASDQSPLFSSSQMIDAENPWEVNQRLTQELVDKVNNMSDSQLVALKTKKAPRRRLKKN